MNVWPKKINDDTVRLDLETGPGLEFAPWWGTPSLGCGWKSWKETAPGTGLFELIVTGRVAEAIIRFVETTQDGWFQEIRIFDCRGHYEIRANDIGIRIPSRRP